MEHQLTTAVASAAVKASREASIATTSAIERKYPQEGFARVPFPPSNTQQSNSVDLYAQALRYNNSIMIWSLGDCMIYFQTNAMESKSSAKTGTKATRTHVSVDIAPSPRRLRGIKWLMRKLVTATRVYIDRRCPCRGSLRLNCLRRGSSLLNLVTRSRRRRTVT